MVAPEMTSEGENARIERLLNDIRPQILGLSDIITEQGCCEFEWRMDCGVVLTITHTEKGNGF